MYAREIGRWCRSKRLEAGMTQAKLAKVSGLHPQRVSQIERGIYDAKLSSLIRMAHGLDVSIVEIARVADAVDKRMERSS